MKLDTNRINKVERNIKPYMAKTITIPIEDGLTRSVCIYVASSSFAEPISDTYLIDIAKRLSLIDDK